MVYVQLSAHLRRDGSSVPTGDNQLEAQHWTRNGESSGGWGRMGHEGEEMREFLGRAGQSVGKVTDLE